VKGFLGTRPNEGNRFLERPDLDFDLLTPGIKGTGIGLELTEAAVGGGERGPQTLEGAGLAVEELTKSTGVSGKDVKLGTSEKIEIPASKAPVFKAGKGLKD
jgi:hypothetical protein